MLFFDNLGTPMVLIDVCAENMSLEEFNVIGNLIDSKFMDTATMLIGTNFVPEYEEQMEVNVLVVKRKMGDEMWWLTLYVEWVG